MGHGMKKLPFHRFLHRFIVRCVRLHDLLNKGQALDPFQLDLRHPLHHQPDKRISVGVQSIGCGCQNHFPFPDRAPINNSLLFHNPCNARGEHVSSRIHHLRLNGCLSAHKGTLIFPAGIGNSLYQRMDRILFRVSADDGIQHGKRLCSHHDDVIDQVVDHIMTDRLRIAVFHCKLLFGPRLLGFQHQNGMLHVRKVNVIKGCESAQTVQHPAVSPLQYTGHLPFHGVRIGNIHPRPAVGKPFLRPFPACQKFIRRHPQHGGKLRQKLDIGACGTVFPFGYRLKRDIQPSRKLLLCHAVLSSFFRNKSADFFRIQHIFPLLSPGISRRLFSFPAIILSCLKPPCTNRRIESTPMDSTAG